MDINCGQKEESKTVKSGIVSTVIIVATSLLRLIVYGALTRILGVENYGEFILLLSIVVIVKGASSFGMPNAVLKWGAVYYHDQNFSSISYLLKRSFFYAGIFTVLFVVPIVFIVEIYSDNYFGKGFDLTFLVVVVPLMVCSEILASFARSMEDIINYFTIKDILPLVSQLVLAYTFLWTNPSVVTAKIIFILSFLVSVIYGVYYLLKNLKMNSMYLAGPPVIENSYTYIKFGLAGAIIGILATFKDRLAVLIIGSLVSPVEAGMIFNATRLSVTLTIVLSGMNIILAPQVAKLHYQNKMDELEGMYRSIVRLVILLVFPVMAFVIFEPQLIMSLVFGHDSDLAGSILLCFFLYKFGSLLVGSPGIFLQMAGIPRYEVFATILSVILGSVSLIFAVNTWGVLPGVIVFGIILFSIDICRGWVVWAKLNISAISFRDLVIILMCLLVVFVLNHGMKILMLRSVSLSIIVSGVISVVFFMILLKDKDKSNLAVIINNFRK